MPSSLDGSQSAGAERSYVEELRYQVQAAPEAREAQKRPAEARRFIAAGSLSLSHRPLTDPRRAIGQGGSSSRAEARTTTTWSASFPEASQ